jgi:heme/copper-type cytochrome/quinol oxidase subunit 2
MRVYTVASLLIILIGALWHRMSVVIFGVVLLAVLYFVRRHQRSGERDANDDAGKRK